MSNFKIRKYQTGDYEKNLHNIERENMKCFVDKFDNGWSDNEEKERFYELLKVGYVYSFIYSDNLIGFVIFVKIENEPVIFIKNIQISKKFQGKGFGSLVLDFIEKETKKLGCTSLELAVFKENPALNFYIKNCFKESKIVPKNKNAIILEKKLN